MFACVTVHGRTPELAFFTVRIRPEVAVERVSPAVEALLGISAAEAQSDPESLLDRLDPGDRAVLTHRLRHAEPGAEFSTDLLWRSAGRDVVTRCAMRTRLRDDGTVALEGTAVDITDLRGDFDVLNGRLRLLAESCCDVVWTQSADGKVAYIVDNIERTRGMTREAALEQSITEMHTPQSAERLTAYVRQVFDSLEAGTQPPLFEAEQEYYRADGSIMVGELKILPNMDREGRFVEMVGIVRDISVPKTREAELDRLAALDPLTGLGNRRHGQEQLAEAIRNRRDGVPNALLLVDIDHFKMANDLDGHHVGDLLLTRTATVLRDAVRVNDIVIRWGGDEFIILLTGCGCDAAISVAEKIRTACINELGVHGRLITVSIGVAVLAGDDDVPSWLGRADRALYEAKRSGRNRAIVGGGD